MWIWNQIFGEFVYVPVSVKRFLFVGGPDRLPRSSYLQWKKSGRNLLHFQLKVGVVVWFFPPFCVQLHSSDWCHCFSMYMYLQPQYCVSYSLNINNFYNFKTGGVLDYLLILCFLQLKYWVKQKKQVCMTFDSISGPRQRRSLQKLEMVIVSVLGLSCLVSRVLVSILLVVLETVSLFF